MVTNGDFPNMGSQLKRKSLVARSESRGYIFRRTVEGIHIIHLGKTWEKLMVAARMRLGQSGLKMGTPSDGHQHPRRNP